MKLRLTLDVDIDAHGIPEQQFRSNLHYIVQNAMGNGTVTGPTEAEVNDYSCKVESLLDIKNKQMFKFEREQLIFVVNAILCGAQDRIDSGLPDVISYEERNTTIQKLGSYEKGALESSGMSLATFYFKLTNDGLGIYDALASAGNFHDVVENLMKYAWNDQGKHIKDRLVKFSESKSLYTMFDVYPGYYPDTRKHAEIFVDNCFKNYLS